MQYDLQSHLDKVYSTFPEAKRKPIIGITTNYMNGDAALRNVYYKQVVAAGGVPMLIPPVADKDVLINTLDHLDGLLLTGGADINPLWLGEEPSPKLHNINAERDLPELMLIRLAFNRQLPILGICRGAQALAVALGGKIQQDIYDEYIREEETVEKKLSKDKTVTTYRAATLKHSQDAERCEATHSVTLNKSSVLYALYKEESLLYTSFFLYKLFISRRLFFLFLRCFTFLNILFCSVYALCNRIFYSTIDKPVTCYTYSTSEHKRKQTGCCFSVD